MLGPKGPVSYTHLDVYKRQPQFDQPCLVVYGENGSLGHGQSLSSWPAAVIRLSLPVMDSGSNYRRTQAAEQFHRARRQAAVMAA